MAHDVFFSEIDELDSLQIRQHAFGFNQATAFTRRQINLSDVARNHCLGPETDACQKHLHLFAGGILRFIENDKSVGQRAPTHEGKRRHLNHLLLEQFGHALVIDQIKQRVVKRTQIRINFLLQVAGEKAKLLAGFHCGTRQYDTVYLLLHQRLHGQRNCEIRLARAGYANAENNVLLLDRLDVFALSCRFGRYLFLAGGIEARLGEVVAQAKCAVLSNLSKGLAQFLVGKRAAFSEEFGEIFENALGSGHILRVAINGNVLTARVNAYIEQRFKIFDVLIVNAEERFEAARWKFDLLQNRGRSPFAERNWFSLFSGV